MPFPSKAYHHQRTRKPPFSPPSLTPSKRRRNPTRRPILRRLTGHLLRALRQPLLRRRSANRAPGSRLNILIQRTLASETRVMRVHGVALVRDSVGADADEPGAFLLAAMGAVVAQFVGSLALTRVPEAGVHVGGGGAGEGVAGGSGGGGGVGVGGERGVGGVGLGCRRAAGGEGLGVEGRGFVGFGGEDAGLVLWWDGLVFCLVESGQVREVMVGGE